jgi:hypothetical protein
VGGTVVVLVAGPRVVEDEVVLEAGGRCGLGVALELLEHATANVQATATTGTVQRGIAAVWTMGCVISGRSAVKGWQTLRAHRVRGQAGVPWSALRLDLVGSRSRRIVQ